MKRRPTDRSQLHFRYLFPSGKTNFLYSDEAARTRPEMNKRNLLTLVQTAEATPPKYCPRTSMPSAGWRHEEPLNPLPMRACHLETRLTSARPWTDGASFQVDPQVRGERVS